MPTGPTDSSIPESLEILGNQFFEVCDSGIHGCGAFARVDIPAETYFVEYVGHQLDKEESNRRGLEREASTRDTGEAAVFIFEVNDEFDIDGNVPWNPAKYLNHSCSANCEAVNDQDRIWFMTKVDVAAGEELTIDYGYGWDHWQDHPCECGSPDCVGYIVAETERKRLRRHLAREERKRQRRETKATPS